VQYAKKRAEEYVGTQWSLKVQGSLRFSADRFPALDYLGEPRTSQMRRENILVTPPPHPVLPFRNGTIGDNVGGEVTEVDGPPRVLLLTDGVSLNTSFAEEGKLFIVTLTRNDEGELVYASEVGHSQHFESRKVFSHVWDSVLEEWSQIQGVEGLPDTVDLFQVVVKGIIAVVCFYLCLLY
jgi:hypothetical protein